jgi:hypothetical protein
MGGLGNQMFQYAAARGMAHRLGTTVKVDVSFLGVANTIRTYELQHLNVQTAVATPKEIEEVVWENSGFLSRVLAGIKQRIGHESPNPNVFREKHFDYNRDIETLPDNIYLDGYWQSEKYFKHIQEIIREEFSFRDPLDQKNLVMANRIANAVSVSIHIRRGDYVSDARTRQFHGICGQDYYNACIEEMRKRLGNPSFFIFSDEPDWVKKTISVPGEKIVVDHNSREQGYMDLRLMSYCRHNIIANSSFSWWAAWLNSNRDKIVCAPRNWFSDFPTNPEDRYPGSWFTL